jgi:glyoxylase-like metal-dependent hydrolase (beta-lactamase superfamily II)
LYGDEFDRLWGELVPVPEESIQVVGAEVLGLASFPTPGHASHHVCYLADDGTLYAGDATGVRIQPSRAVLPPTPPPEFDLETWQKTLDDIERRSPERLALIHFGVADDPGPHIADLRAGLERWTTWVGDGMSRDEFIRAGQEELGPDRDAYEQAMPLWQSYAGLERYWQKKLEDTSGA